MNNKLHDQLINEQQELNKFKNTTKAIDHQRDTLTVDIIITFIFVVLIFIAL